MIVRIQIPESHLQSLAVPSTETERSELLSIDQSMSLSDGDVKLTDKQTNRQTDKQTNRQTDKLRNTLLRIKDTSTFPMCFPYPSFMPSREIGTTTSK